jgi:subtilisin family serine protease
VGANEAWYAGYRGAGQAVAILDTGVDFTHPAFNNTDRVRVVSEACYSTGSAAYGSISLCPDQARESVAPGSGADCVATLRARGAGSVSTCAHGTHVAGIATGNDGLSVVGVAPDAGLISIQVSVIPGGKI